MTNDQRVEILAAACHSSWFSYTVLGLGEPGEPWPTAPDWQKDSLRAGVKFWDAKCAEQETEMPFESMIRLLAPLSHVNWMAHKKAEGWVYGPEKDPEKKTHHCMVPYNDLPEDQKKKDAVVIQAYLSVRATL
jgi:hypothetical protein